MKRICVNVRCQLFPSSTKHGGSTRQIIGTTLARRAPGSAVLSGKSAKFFDFYDYGIAAVLVLSALGGPL